MDAKEREKICNKCPININGRCSSKYWINKEDDVSAVAKPGYVQGCNCFINYKVSRPWNHCVIGKW